MSVKKIPAQPAKVVVEVIMTPEEYQSISTNASWDGRSIEQYLIDCALGNRRRGC